MMGSYVSLVLLTRTTSNVNAVLGPGSEVDVVDGGSVVIDVIVVDENGVEGGGIDAAEEGAVDPEDGDANVEDDEENEDESVVDVLDSDERMPTLTPNGAVADALALVWNIDVVLIVSGTDCVEVDGTAVEAFELDDVLTSTVELVAMVVVVVGSGTVDDSKLEDEYKVTVDVELTYSVVVEYSVIVVQVVGDCAIVKPIHTPVARMIVLFMVDIRCDGAQRTRWCQSVRWCKILSRRMETTQKRRGMAMVLCIAHISGGWKMQS